MLHIQWSDWIFVQGPKTAYSGKKKRTREMDDYYDLGDGYDIDDPFIDNTEAVTCSDMKDYFKPNF